MNSDALEDRTLAEQVAAILASLKGAAPKEAAREERPARKPILVTGRNLAELTAETWREVLDAMGTNPTILRKPPELVRVALDPARLEVLNEIRLRHEVAELVPFVAARASGLVEECSPPKDLVQNMGADSSAPIPEIVGLADGFTFTNGRPCSTPGYNPESKKWIYNPLAIVPFDGSGIEAAKWLHDEMHFDVPFASMADSANALGFLIGYFDVGMIGRPPAFDSEGSTPGAGKGLLIETTFTAAYGAEGFVITPIGENDDETRKKITAGLRSGIQAISFDNVNSIDSPSLAALLTAPFWTDRVLGISENITIRVSLVVGLTSNNPVFSGEIARRLGRCRIEPREQHPEERSGFKHPDLKKWVLEHRGEIAGAVARIFESWTEAGRPQWSGRPLGSFEKWSANVGGILEHVGIEGFLENRREVYSLSDSVGTAWANFVKAWNEIHGGREVGVRELFEITARFDSLPIRGNTDQGRRASFGRLLSKQRGRVFDDLEVIYSPSGANGALYHLVNIRETEVTEVKEGLTVSRARTGETATLEPSYPSASSEDLDAELDLY